MRGAEIAPPPVYRISLAQLILLVSIAAVLAVVDRVWAYSVFGGGLIAIVPQAGYAAVAFSWRGARSARAMGRASYTAAAFKFALNAIGFALLFALVRPIDGLAVFAGYLAMLVAHITGSWLLVARRRQEI